MTSCVVKQQVQAMAVSEGAGVTVHRTIGTPALRQLDPFLMLDHFSSDDPDDYIAGFPDHPHRGFITFTYMLDGHMLHRDSMGNRGDLKAGGAQWMKAASGVIHSEMPQQSAGMMRGFQLWINLPASEKMSAPAYQEFSAQKIPVVETDNAVIKVLVGEFQGVSGPVHDPYSQVQYLDVTLRADSVFTRQWDQSLQGFVYIFEGQGRVGNTELPQHHLAVLADGDELKVNSSGQQTRFIMVAGRPLREAVVQYGPFVMNTQEQIQQALADYRDGRLVRDNASFVGD